MKHLFIIASFFLSLCITHAQPYVDIASLNAGYYFPSSNLIDKNNSSSIIQSTALLSIPMALEDSNYLITGARFGTFIFDDAYHSSIKSAMIQAGYIRQFSLRLKTLFMFIARANSDFDHINRSHMQAGGLVLITYKYSKKLQCKLGLYYNREFYGNYFLPLAGIEYTLNPRNYIFGVMPGSLAYEHKFTNNLYAGIAYQSFQGTYRLSEDNDANYVRVGEKFWACNVFKLFINYYIAKNIMLFAEGGYTLFPYFQTYNKGDEKVNSPHYFERTNTACVFGGIAYRIRLDKE